MRKIVTCISSLCIASSAASAFEGQKTFMPENDLHLQDGFLDGGLTETQFNDIIARAEAIYQPIVSQFGATLTINRRWNDDTVNASAEQPSSTNWRINMYGGLARRPEVTEDGFAMVVCHELGHHLAGFPFVESWAANEGQSDMHSTGACAAKLFTMNLELKAAAEASLPDQLRAKCDANRPENEREICYRSIIAGKSLSDLLAALNDETVDFSTPDTTVVTRTNHNHPAAQCRLDTYVASALCGADRWDYSLIPGKSFDNNNSMAAQVEAFDHSCSEGDGARPKCWFAPITSDNPTGECPLGDSPFCDIFCRLNPNLPWCS